jgi:hypothetical protein
MTFTLQRETPGPSWQNPLSLPKPTRKRSRPPKPLRSLFFLLKPSPQSPRLLPRYSPPAPVSPASPPQPRAPLPPHATPRAQGMLPGDKVTHFGSVDKSNFRSLHDIAQLVQNAVGVLPACARDCLPRPRLLGGWGAP